MKLKLACVAFAALALCGLGQAAARAEERTMPVPLKTIYMGETLDPSLFSGKLFTVNAVAMQNYAMDISQLMSMQAARTLPAGKPIALRSIKPANDVSRGKSATARFLADGIAIEASLVPMQDGVAGQQIDAKNPASGVVVKALVNKDGTLTVSGE